MTLKQILRRAPEDAVALLYIHGKCKFYGPGTHILTESRWTEYDYQTCYQESRFLASKINGKWIPCSVLSEKQIAQILEAANRYTERNPCGLEEVVKKVIALLNE